MTILQIQSKPIDTMGLKSLQSPKIKNISIGDLNIIPGEHVYPIFPTRELETNTIQKQERNLEKTLNLQSKLEQRSVMKFLKTVDWRTSSNSPFVVELDPTSMCNLACPDCISGSLLNKDEIPSERLLNLTSEMIDAGVKAVILIGGGEPMMHPAIGEVMRRLGEADVRIGITTNGLYLRKHLDVTADYSSWVRVSMDAGTDATFNRIRPSKTGKSLFASVIKNMETFARVKRGKLGYSFMIFNEGDFGFKGIPITNNTLNNNIHQIKTNVHEIYTAAKLARDIGCDYFEIKPMYDVNHYAIMQPEDLTRIVDEQVEMAKELETFDFKILEATKLWASLHGESNLEPKEYQRCAVAQARTLVTPSGVYVCPYFRGSEHKKIGDIQTQSFSEMWHGQQRKMVINKLDPSRDCSMHCIRHESNQTIERWIVGGFPLPSDDFDLFI
jgi:MoaA/NifB/PqqE/SkfB family radical SAM enzyme